MAPKKQPYKSLSKSAKAYRKSKSAREKKKKYDTEYNKKTVSDRVERNRARRKAKKKYGASALKGKDVAHTKNGTRLKSVKANRGSKSDTSGDRRARGGKKKK